MSAMRHGPNARRRFLRTLLCAAAGGLVLRSKPGLAGSAQWRVALPEERRPPSSADLRAPHDLAG